MKAGRASAILLAAVAALCLGPATALAAPAPTPPGTVAEDGFRTEGSFYVCVASGTGSSAQAIPDFCGTTNNG